MKNSLLQQKEQVHFQYRKKTLVEIQKLDCLEYANSYLELIFLLLFSLRECLSILYRLLFRNLLQKRILNKLPSLPASKIHMNPSRSGYVSSE